MDVTGLQGVAYFKLTLTISKVYPKTVWQIYFNLVCCPECVAYFKVTSSSHVKENFVKYFSMFPQSMSKVA